MRESGIQVLLDDFGTGYSSLNYLHDLPIDAIKLDRTFIRDMSLDGKHPATIQRASTLTERSVERGQTIDALALEPLYARPPSAIPSRRR